MKVLVSLLPIRFVSASIPSFHRHFYPEQGLLEYELMPSPLTDLSFNMNNNPIGSLMFFMLIIKPPPERIHYTFFTPSFHDQFYHIMSPKKMIIRHGKLDLQCLHIHAKGRRWIIFSHGSSIMRSSFSLQSWSDSFNRSILSEMFLFCVGG